LSTRAPVEVVSVQRRDRTVWFLVGVVVAAVVLAILKPWSLAGPDSGPRSTLAALAPTVSPSSSSSASTGPGPETCLSHQAWRLVTAEHTSGRDIKSWIAVEPARADDPTDRSIPTVAVVADRLLGIGLCAPPFALLAVSGGESAVLWTVNGSAFIPVRLHALRTFDGFGAGEGQLYAPPRNVAVADAWPYGRYLIELRGLGDASLWFAFRVSPPPGRATSSP
jgi:hypothetical protein